MLDSITISELVTSIGHNAFQGSSVLKKVYFCGTKEPDSIGTDVFIDNALLSKINVATIYECATFCGILVEKPSTKFTFQIIPYQ